MNTASKNIDLTGCKTDAERMFTAIDVAIQWLDEDKPKIAREVLAEVYNPILKARED